MKEAVIVSAMRSVPQGTLKAFYCLLGLILSACGQVSQSTQNVKVFQEADKSPRFDLIRFESNRAKWRDCEIKDYSINIDASGFLRPFLPAIIEVRNSKLASIRPQYASKNEHWVNTYKDLKLTTVEELFVFIESQQKQNPDLLEVIYDEEYGFPASILLDRKKGWSDDELSVSVSNFHRM